MRPLVRPPGVGRRSPRLWSETSGVIDMCRHFEHHGFMTTSPTDKILDRVREAGMLRPRDLEDSGIPGTYLARLARRGLLARIGRGVSTLPGAPAGRTPSA